ncbi:hypothetical protein BKA70DRAFT_1420800 [Coprinopsis sp. MPI-PUGE-AT-0042]|nr:hypothetical protein BKA70DRAFT_1420800 [Coprinopsis sp. MPI-PUGE-AT-0042]
MEQPQPTAISAPLPDVGKPYPDQEGRTRELFANTKVSLDALSAAFESLYGQTLHLAAVNGAAGSKEIVGFRSEIAEQERRHQEGVNEIQGIINDLLEQQFVGKTREEVEQEISGHIDEMVKDAVGECLQAHVPDGLQAEMEDNKKELERARIALHNSESRRMNNKLRADNSAEPLETLLMPNGNVSSQFPKDLDSMFNLDAQTCKALAHEYEIPEISDSRDRNLNKFMQFCGVRYQLVEF